MWSQENKQPKGLEIMKKKIVSCILSIITVFTLCAGTIGASASAAPRHIR
jgi:hypothetical protein